MYYAGTLPTVQSLIEKLQKLPRDALVEVRGAGLVDLDYGIDLEIYRTVDLMSAADKNSVVESTGTPRVILYSR